MQFSGYLKQHFLILAITLAFTQNASGLFFHHVKSKIIHP